MPSVAVRKSVIVTACAFLVYIFFLSLRNTKDTWTVQSTDKISHDFVNQIANAEQIIHFLQFPVPPDVRVELDMSHGRIPAAYIEKQYGGFLLFGYGLKIADALRTSHFFIQVIPSKSLTYDEQHVMEDKRAMYDFRIILRSGHTLTDARVQFYGKGLYRVDYVLDGEYKDGYKLLALVEYANVTEDALVATNPHSSDPERVAPKLRKIAEAFPGQEVLYRGSVTLGTNDASTETLACSWKYGAMGRWKVFDTKAACNQGDSIGYFHDHFMYIPYNCTIKWFCLDQAHACLLQYKRIIVIGDSYARETYTDMAKLLLLRRSTWDAEGKQQDATVILGLANKTTQLEYYFDGKLRSLFRRFGQGRRLSETFWTTPTPPDIVLIDHGMWSVFLLSLDDYRSELKSFMEQFLNRMLRQMSSLQGLNDNWRMPKIIFISMPSTLNHPGWRSRPRIDFWNKAAEQVIVNVTAEFNRQHPNHPVDALMLDYFHSTDMRPDASDGNHFGDWMNVTDGRPPVLNKNNVNLILNLICN